MSCREHHFNENKDFTRCSVCAMQRRYYYEAILALSNWTDAEKKDPLEHWRETVDSYKCKPHDHEVEKK